MATPFAVGRASHHIYSAPRKESCGMNLDKERVLVLGASGWFGREFLHLTQGNRGDTYCVASEAREISASSLSYFVNTYDIKEIAAFNPTVVVDCSGLNRYRQYKATFLSECLNLTLDYLRVMALPGVKAGLTFSSGAAAFNPLGAEFDDYSVSKIIHERLVQDTIAPSVIMRCYAVTGSLCQEREGYAASEFVDMAKKGKIKVRAERPTFRRYMAIDDYFRCGLAELGKSTTLDSSGYWVELEDFAQIIADQTGAKMKRQVKEGSPVQYGSNDQRCFRIAERDGFKIKTLPEQVAALLT